MLRGADKRLGYWVALFVFGLLTTSFMEARAEPVLTPAQRIIPPPIGGARVTGQLTELSASSLSVVVRTGQTIEVDITSARQNDAVSPINVGAIVQIEGSLSGNSMVAAVVRRAKSNPQSWLPDAP